MKEYFQHIQNTPRPSISDLLFCDSMGIVIIPDEIADELAKACRRIIAAEWPVLWYVKQAQIKGTEIDIDILVERQREMLQLREKGGC